MIASGSSDDTIRLWDVATGETLNILEGHWDWINSVAFSPDGETLASGGDDDDIHLWDVATGEELKTLGGHTAEFDDAVNSVAFSSGWSDARKRGC